MGKLEKEKSLTVETNDGVLSITIGTDILCHSCEIGRRYGNGDIKITDEKLFVDNLVNELDREDEDGGTLLHEAFDKAVNRMLENGEHGLDLLDDD